MAIIRKISISIPCVLFLFCTKYSEVDSVNRRKTSFLYLWICFFGLLYGGDLS